MFNELSQRVNAIKPFPTLAVSNLASQLRARGRDVIRAGSDRPGCNAPENIHAAASAAALEDNYGLRA